MAAYLTDPPASQVKTAPYPKGNIARCVQDQHSPLRPRDDRITTARPPRRGAGVVERGGLENRCGRKPTQGSNPCLSAILFVHDIVAYAAGMQSRLHLSPGNLRLLSRMAPFQTEQPKLPFDRARYCNARTLALKNLPKGRHSGRVRARLYQSPLPAPAALWARIVFDLAMPPYCPTPHPPSLCALDLPYDRRATLI